MLLERGLRFIQQRHTRNSVKSETPFVHGQMESPNTSPQAIELIPSCWEQLAYSNRPGTGLRYKNTEPRCILAVLRVPFRILFYLSYENSILFIL